MVSSTIFELTSRYFRSSNQHNLKDYVKIYPLTTDETPLNYNSFLPDRIGNNSLNSTLIQQENLNGTKNLTQQDIQTPSHFTNEEVVTTVTTTQQSISPIHPNLTTPRPKNPILPQVTLHSTVKPSIVPKYSHMDYQTFRPMTKPTQKQRTFTRKNFAEHNYNYLNRPQTSKPPRTNTQNQLFSHRQNFQQPTTNLVIFNDYSGIFKVIIIHFFNKIITINNKTKINIKHLITHLIIFHQMMKNFRTKIKDSTLTRTSTRYF